LFILAIQDIFLFYYKSAPRWALLAPGNNVAKIILKKVCTTRWETKHKYVLKSLINLKLIILYSNNPDDKFKALYCTLEKIFWIYFTINNMGKYLKKLSFW